MWSSVCVDLSIYLSTDRHIIYPTNDFKVSLFTRDTLLTINTNKYSTHLKPICLAEIKLYTC